MADVELVIKMPEEVYKSIINGKNYISYQEYVEEAIKNGTPLQKGHGDLIDVNRKITVSTYDEQYEEWGEKTMTVIDALNKWSDEGVTAEDIIIPGIALVDTERIDNENRRD